MLMRLLSRSEDLGRVAAKGYDITWIAGHLVVRDVPYVNSARQVKLGMLLIVVNEEADGKLVMPNHQAYFAGDPFDDTPCDENGAPLTGIGNSLNIQEPVAGLRTGRFFSAKPANKNNYDTIYDKVTTYVKLLGSSALVVDPASTAEHRRPLADTDNETPFHYMDSASTRAQIMAVSQKLEGQIISIIGLGGSGSYVLDQVAKAPVREIRLFDKDVLEVHSAFRAPSAPSLDDLKTKPRKVDYFTQLYGKMKRNIVPRPVFITAENLAELAGSSYVFLCIDDAPAKAPIMAYLRQQGIPFTHVGLGLRLAGTSIVGSVDVTTITNQVNGHLDTISTAGGGPAEVYRANIQVADLNALSALLAVIRWKKSLGFYVDEEHEHSTTYSVKLNELLNGDRPNPA
jgi:hypothetical protein